MKFTFYTLLFLFVAVNMRAQLLSVAPAFPQDNSTVTITVDCAKGNKGLLNYVNPGDVYVHTGVITSSSASSSDWRYVKFSNFNVGDPSVKATALGNNKYSFTITNIRSFYGVPAGETIKKIAILFRNGAGSVVQRNSDASDMYLTVYGASLAGKFALPLMEPRFVSVAEPIQKNVGDNIGMAYTVLNRARSAWFLTERRSTPRTMPIVFMPTLLLPLADRSRSLEQ